MWFPEQRAACRRLAAIATALALAALTAGCFQPLYGDRPVTGGPDVRAHLSGVDVVPINAPNGTPVARLAVEVRNALIFELTGGSGMSAPTHQLQIQLSPTRQQVIVDITTARPDIENYGIDATYSLTELGSKKVVVTGRTFARVSFDIPGQQQRFARARGLRDAEDRASKVIAEHIRSRMASYFVTGT